MSEGSIISCAEVTQAVRRSTGRGIHCDLLKETAGVVGEVQQTAELILRTRLAGFIVIVLLLYIVAAKLKRVPPEHPGHCVTQIVGILGQASRRGS